MRLSSAKYIRLTVCSILACAMIANELLGQAAAPAPAGNNGAATQPSVMKFKRYTVQDDRQFKGMVAAYGIMPLGWTVKSSVGPKLNLRMHWGDAQDTSACDIYPPISFRWYTKGVGARPPAGAVRPPADQFEAITDTFIPQFRPDLAKAKVIDKQKMPDLAKATYQQLTQGGGGQNISVAAGYEIFQYDVQGQSIKEYVKLVLSESGDRSSGIIFWTLSTATSRRAPEKLFDQETRIEQITMNSATPNPAWTKSVNDYRMNKLNAQNAQRNANFQATENRIASDSAAEDAQQQGFENHMSDLDTQSNNEADVQREVSPWQSSDGSVYKLPTQYGAAWTGSDGTILMGNDPSYNPNADSSLPSNATWTQMQPTKN